MHSFVSRKRYCGNLTTIPCLHGGVPPESTIHGTVSGLLADYPRNFRNRSQTIASPADVPEAHTGHKDHIVRVWDHEAPQNPIAITDKGIRITSRVIDLHAAWNPEQSMILILSCSPGGDTERATGIYIRRQYEDRYVRVRTADLADVRLSHGGDHHTRHTLHGLKAGSADICGLQFDQALDNIVRHPSRDLWLRKGPRASTSMAAHRCTSGTKSKSSQATTVFGAYILDSMGIRQAHGAWRFFRFDPQQQRQRRDRSLTRARGAGLPCYAARLTAWTSSSSFSALAW